MNTCARSIEHLFHWIKWPRVHQYIAMWYHYQQIFVFTTVILEPIRMNQSKRRKSKAAQEI